MTNMIIKEIINSRSAGSGKFVFDRDQTSVLALNSLHKKYVCVFLIISHNNHILAVAGECQLKPCESTFTVSLFSVIFSKKLAILGDI